MSDGDVIGVFQSEKHVPNYLDEANVFASTEFLSDVAVGEVQIMQFMQNLHSSISRATNLLSE